MDYQEMLKFCQTERQAEIVQAIIKAGGQGSAAKALGVCQRTVEYTVERIKRNAARKGNAPGHWNMGTAAGFEIIKATSHYRKNKETGEMELEAIWPRQSPVADAMNALQAALENFKPKPAPRIKQPRKTSQDLLTFYTITDFHLGMYAWAAETGDDWDTAIASRVLMNAINDMADKSPDAETGILNLQGDFLHWDGIDALTPQNRHVLDADTRIGQLIDLALDVTIWTIERLLEKHKKVVLFVCEGNHDLVGSKWLAKAMARIFAKNPRLTVDPSEFPFYAYLHGETMIGIHHAHKVKNKALPALFSSEPRFRAMWGKATYTYIHTGHYHHTEQDMAEAGGAIVERHPTLAARDAYAARGGYVARRAARAITYDKIAGEVSRITVVPR